MSTAAKKTATKKTAAKKTATKKTATISPRDERAVAPSSPQVQQVQPSIRALTTELRQTDLRGSGERGTLVTADAYTPGNNAGIELARQWLAAVSAPDGFDRTASLFDSPKGKSARRVAGLIASAAAQTDGRDPRWVSRAWDLLNA